MFIPINVPSRYNCHLVWITVLELYFLEYTVFYYYLFDYTSHSICIGFISHDLFLAWSHCYHLSQIIVSRFYVPLLIPKMLNRFSTHFTGGLDFR